NYVPNPNLRAYVDTLDGRATNRYFYRAAYVDGSHNRSPLSLSSPPIWLPDVIPPAEPRLLKVLVLRQILIDWYGHRSHPAGGPGIWSSAEGTLPCQGNGSTK